VAKTATEEVAESMTCDIDSCQTQSNSTMPRILPTKRRMRRPILKVEEVDFTGA